jgi:nucleoside 2-deoxyribosyltransferase
MIFPEPSLNLDSRGKEWSLLAFRDSLRESKGSKIMNTQNKTNTAALSPKKHQENNKSFSVYLAGDLWTHKDLIGNALLGDCIKKVSRGRYHCVLPQDLEEPINRTVDIRNVDLKHVMMSDMAIFNFDGANLDSGTVVEFIYAKMLDIPCVLLRTDFRAAGEGNQEQDPWNLMASHWPRSKVLKLHGMAEYQSAKAAGSLAKTIANLYRKMSTQIVEALDSVREEAPLVTNPERMKVLYDWALQCPGSGFSDLFTASDMQQLHQRKMAKGLLAKAAKA